MLPRSQRLSVQQFDFVMEKGRAYHSTLFLLRVKKVGSSTRVSATVPNKVAKKATDRNYLRRKMYESIRLIYGNIVAGQHIIVFAKSAAVAASFEQLNKEMCSIFVKAGLLM